MQMDKEKIIQIREKIFDDYRGKIYIAYSFDPKFTTAEAFLETRLVLFPQKFRTDPDEYALFTILHEIGHLMTNNQKQKRYYQEYLATQWAIEKSKKYGIPVSQKTLRIYQEYILRWRDSSIKRKGKNIHSIERVILKY